MKNTTKEAQGGVLQFTLGDGFAELGDFVNGEYSGPKYADVALYENGKPILPFLIDHHSLELDANIWEFTPMMQSIADKLNQFAPQQERIKQLLGAIRRLDSALAGNMSYEHQVIGGDPADENCETPAKLVRSLLNSPQA